MLRDVMITHCDDKALLAVAASSINSTGRRLYQEVFCHHVVVIKKNA
jgi:hypothetical protein